MSSKITKLFLPFAIAAWAVAAAAQAASGAPFGLQGASAMSREAVMTCRQRARHVYDANVRRCTDLAQRGATGLSSCNRHAKTRFDRETAVCGSAADAQPPTVAKPVKEKDYCSPTSCRTRAETNRDSGR